MEFNDILKKGLEDSIKAAFTTTVSFDPEIVDEIGTPDEECIISSIGFTGTIEGTFSICLPDTSACKIVSKMLAMEIDEAFAYATESALPTSDELGNNLFFR